MRKPQERHFFTGYIMLWLVLVIWAGCQAGAHAVIAINLLFVCINLIGTCFATGGHVPWRDNDPEPIRPRKVGRMMSQPNPDHQIVADSPDWTGRR